MEMLPYWAEQARAVAARSQDGEAFGRTHDDPERIAAVRQHARDDLRELAAGCGLRSTAPPRWCVPSPTLAGSGPVATPAAAR